jgi:hypothetical protein
LLDAPPTKKFSYIFLVEAKQGWLVNFNSGLINIPCFLLDSRFASYWLDGLQIVVSYKGETD